MQNSIHNIDYGARGVAWDYMGHDPLNSNQHGGKRIRITNAIILRVTSLGRDAQNERDGAGLRSSIAAATPSQQQLRRSSNSAWQQQLRRSRSSNSVAAATPSQQHYNLAVALKTQRDVSASFCTSAAGSTSRRDELLSSSVAAAAAQLHRSSSNTNRRRNGPATMSVLSPLEITGPGGWPRTVGHDH